ncbi:hypothetical protein C1940_08765 [Lactiplantibacillus plantarum subsp. plantarum]|uniref:hypothetical protein n=1 Tax=Lactiplantibacillus plantarum TaxID=1590 RepID=UPI000CD351CF|nr:hypothetical protein [Lactiplantibacillus plantarum]AUV70951.1 hypothetical protein C1940_00025 [Lactiplantibacillus plantarum subsp. plantarum]AUV72174.1 hypothetical protein C1940_06710 [Lactiplantibacillus plantarum subsp. plantarum]AUV72554.1 hypothetical protein C1940_08765 [Lactiplantibacillus plantarum subsp. plantarum]
MSQEEFETTQAISTVCFDLVRQGYSLNEIRSGLGNTMSAVGSDNNSAQYLLDEYNRKMKELSDQVDFYCGK